MNPQLFELSDENRVRLRWTISDIDRQVRCLSHEDTVANHRAATSRLTTSWADLVKLLALAAPPPRFVDQRIRWTALPDLEADSSVWRWRQ